MEKGRWCAGTDQCSALLRQDQGLYLQGQPVAREDSSWGTSWPLLLPAWSPALMFLPGLLQWKQSPTKRLSLTAEWGMVIDRPPPEGRHAQAAGSTESGEAPTVLTLGVPSGPARRPGDPLPSSLGQSGVSGGQVRGWGLFPLNSEPSPGLRLRPVLLAGHPA